jgi:hypothetical protein
MRNLNLLQLCQFHPFSEFSKNLSPILPFKTPEKACQIKLAGMVLYMQQKDLRIQDIDLMGQYGIV